MIALSNLYIYYSWINIASFYNNNTFSYVWYDAGGAITFDIVVPDGFYSVATLNAYLQSQMIANGTYLIDSVTNENIYYLTLTTNPAYYALEIRANPIPTSLPAGYTQPTNWIGSYPATATTPQMIIPNTKIQELSGFPAGTYPPTPQSTTYNVLSPNTPQVAVVQSVVVLCSLLRNTLTNPNTILYTFTAGGRQFGELIYFSVPELIFTEIQDGFYDGFEITFVNQNYEPMIIKDSNIVLQLVIQQRDMFTLGYMGKGGKF